MFKYPKLTNKDHKKSLVKNMKVSPKKKKTKSNNMGVNNIKISLKVS